jgi:DNA-binding transcriptional regulator GbsR (MarR family)
MKSQADNELCSLAQEIGNFIQYWGFKKIHGQIWTLVFLSDKPLNSTYITKKLSVSKALVSLAIKDLLKFEVIQVVERKSKEIYFSSNPDILKVVTNVLKNRESVMLEKIKKHHEALKDFKGTHRFDFKSHPDRVEELGIMIESAQITLREMIKNGWNQQ